MEQKELQWDKLLKIRTTGRDDSRSDQYRFPYEPTPYSVLERLANSGYVGKKNVILDYGCGKGRVDFYLSYQIRCKSIGIEYDDRIYEALLLNQKNAISGARCEFHLQSAETFQVPEEVDTCFFFNPFSVEILQKVLVRILDSYYDNPREIKLMFYYPSDEYIGALMMQDELLFVDEINCEDLFEGKNEREKIVIFELSGI